MTNESYEIIYLNAGKGKRTWPLALVSSLNFLSKSLLRMMGFSQFESQVYEHMPDIPKNLHIIAKEKENRKDLLERIHQEDGHIFGFESVSWTHPLKDPNNTGSGLALCQAILDQPDLTGIAVVLPNDNYFHLSIDDAVRKHKESGAVITVLETIVDGNDAKKYGLIKKAGDLVEKMGEKIKTFTGMSKFLGYKVTGTSKVSVNGGAYIINVDKIRELINDAQDRWIANIMAEQGEFDIATHLIPGILERKLTIGTYAVEKWADLGGLGLILKTMHRVLSGEFPYFQERLRKENHYVELPGNVWIHNKSYKENLMNGKTLEELMNSTGPDKVTIGPNVYIGSNCYIYPGASIQNSNIEKDTMVGSSANISGSYISMGTQIADNAVLQNSLTSDGTKIGPYANITKSVVGADINVPTGVTLNEVVVWPQYKFNGENISYTKEVLLNKPVMRANLKTLVNGEDCYWPTRKHQRELLHEVSLL